MSMATLPNPSRPWRRRALRGLILAAAPLLLPALLLVVALDTRPRIADPGPPDARAASHTRDVADGLRSFLVHEGEAGLWSMTEAEANAVLAAAQRLAPGSFGRARIDDRAATIDLAVDLAPLAPALPAALWLNLHLAVAPSGDGLRIASARIGRLPLPPALARAGLRLALDRKLGDGLGSDALATIAAVRLHPQRATVVFDFDAVGRDAFFARLRTRALAAAGATAREQVYVQLWHLDRAARRGELPRQGSLLPYLDKAVRVAARQKGDPREEMRAALYALALYCGDPDFGDQIGVTMQRSMRGRANGCAGTTLGGRDDFKRHFVISAGLEAATAGGAAFGVGELKELLDSNDGGSGFSFRDMVADAAGVAFARTFLAAAPDRWPATLARLDDETAILPGFEDLPENLTEAAFRARFRDVDSPAYAAMVADIEARVAALPLHTAAY